MIQILAAEDNRTDVRLLRMALDKEQDWPAELIVTEDGDKTLDYLRGARPRLPDLLILDLNLPRRDGVEVLQAVRATLALCALPVIVLSSSPLEAIETRVRKGNVAADAYFSKPFDLDEFLDLGRQIRRCYEVLSGAAAR